LRAVRNLIKHDLYVKAFHNTLDAYLDDQEPDVMSFMTKMIVYGVKAVNSKKDPEIITQEDAERDFHYVEAIKSFMGSLTPEEFVNLFPIDKEFNGHKYECKDYFYTRDYLKGLDLNSPIGKEIDEFLWEYTNMEIRMFNVRVIGCMRNLRRLAGNPGIMEEWAEDNGVKTFTMHTDQKGKQFLFDKETGKTTRVKKVKPRYLKVIRENTHKLD